MASSSQPRNAGILLSASAEPVKAAVPHLQKTVALICSTMRSGSTLLKALLAEAEDVSHLPEVNFQHYRHQRTARARIESLHPARIVVLKRPAWYHETGSYPRLPAVSPLKTIVLVRDVYETVVSLRQMTFGKMVRFFPAAGDRFLVHYWARVNARLCDVLEHVEAGKGGKTGAETGIPWGLGLQGDATLVRYEDLVSDPLSVTRKLFAFLGSERKSGADRYRVPEGFGWKWGSDDGGPRIRGLRVLSSAPCARADRRLVATVGASPLASLVRRQLNYPERPA